MVMKKKCLSSYFIILMLFCQVLAVMPAGALDKKQEESIKSHCDEIKEDLKNVQREDAKVRVHLGGE